MLRGIRKASANWLGRIVMGVVMTFIAGSFAIWGINDIFRGYGTSSLAKIGRTEIPIDQFRQTYNDRLQQLGQRLGRPVAPEQAKALGLDRQVLGQLVVEAGLDQLAHQMRLGIPDAEIAQSILNNPNFQTPTGQFDRARFKDFLRSIGYSEQRFVDQQRRTIPRREITDTISGNIIVPKTLLDAVSQFQNQQRSIQYVRLGPGLAGDIPQPTDAELKKFFDDRRILFRAPEYRKVDTVAVTPAELEKSIKVTEEDVKHDYEQDIGSYFTPEQRQVEQIVFPTLAQAQAASARIKSGLSFAALAAERGLKQSDIDLGVVPKSGIIDPAVAEAAYSLKKDEVSTPVQGRFGAVLVTVLRIEPKQTKSLSVVAPFIRNDIALERAKRKAQDIHDKIEDARAGGSTLEEAAQKLNLPVVTFDVDRSGRDPSGKPITNLPDSGAVVRATFASDIGVDNDPIETNGGYVWYNVAAITPAHNRTLDEVKSQVEQHWRDDQIAKLLKARASDLLDKLKNGTALDALAVAYGLKLQTASNLKRGAASPGIPAKVIDAAFHTAKGAFGDTEGAQSTEWFVFGVSDIKTPSFDANSADGKKLDQLLQQQMGDAIFSQYVAWLENELGTSVNQAVLAQAVGQTAPDTD